MESLNLSELSNEALAQEEKKQKNNAWVFRIVMVVTMCAAIWSATHKGSLLISWLPLILLVFFGKSENRYKAVQAEIQARKIQ